MNNKNNIHVLLSLSLFLLFVIGSFLVITYEVRGYQIINRACDDQDDLAVPLSYLNTQLKQNDQNNAGTIVSIQGINCLRLQGTSTVTYIYYQDGYLQELYTSLDYQVDLKQGTKLFALDYFSLSEHKGLYTFVVEKNGLQKQLAVYLHN